MDVDRLTAGLLIGVAAWSLIVSGIVYDQPYLAEAGWVCGGVSLLTIAGS